MKIKSKLFRNIAISAVIGLSTIGVVVAPIVARAEKYDELINALNQDSAAKQGNIAQLGSEAADLGSKLADLQNQISALQGQIQDNQAKSADLSAQMVKAQQELDKNKSLLSSSIRQMYLEGQISTLEMLASSKDLSEFLDKQQYRTSVQDKISSTLDKINELKNQLKTQKEEVEKLLIDLQRIQSDLASQQAEQARILALNQQQQSELDGQIRANNSKAADLRKQQIIENARFIGSGSAGTGPACGGGYPGRWCNIPQDSVIDSWGMYNRECVSYTAWKVAVSGRHMPFWGGVGNANQWDDNARAAGIPVDGNPTAGDVAISNSGSYGHAMYVESVNGDGTINISQYNAALNGQFSYRNGLNPSGLVFIHF